MAGAQPAERSQPGHPGAPRLLTLADHQSAQGFGSGTLSFSTGVQPIFADTHCTSWGVAACSGYELTKYPDASCTRCNPQLGPDNHVVQVDVSAMVPVGIDNLAFEAR
jgi:hypothetical protein